MSYGSTAYESFVRIHLESGEPRQPTWNALPHLGRLAWEAAAQAVAMAIVPELMNLDPSEIDEDDHLGEYPDPPVQGLHQDDHQDEHQPEHQEHQAEHQDQHQAVDTAPESGSQTTPADATADDTPVDDTPVDDSTHDASTHDDSTHEVPAAPVAIPDSPSEPVSP
jgi:hypothetical protein